MSSQLTRTNTTPFRLIKSEPGGASESFLRLVSITDEPLLRFLPILHHQLGTKLNTATNELDKWTDSQIKRPAPPFYADRFTKGSSRMTSPAAICKGFVTASLLKSYGHQIKSLCFITQLSLRAMSYINSKFVGNMPWSTWNFLLFSLDIHMSG